MPTNNKNKSVLFFSPHPDDHFSAAGTIFKLREKGYDYYEVLFANGETGGHLGKTQVDPNELRGIRSLEFQKASVLFGTKKYYKLNIPNNDIHYTRDLMFELIKIIREVRPSLAIIPHTTDYHRDHREVSEISADALLRADNSFALHLGERYRVPVILQCRGINPLLKIDMLVDISEQYSKVLDLVEIYNSQVTPRMLQYVESLPSLSGYYMRAKYAEEFEIPRNLPIIPNDVLVDLA